MPRVVFYYTQMEAGSDIQHPDSFMLQIDSDITIGDVVKSFPLSKFGNYHIRFRKNIDDSYEWAEPQDMSDSVPTYNGGIFLKVLNLDKIRDGLTKIKIEDSIVFDEDEYISVNSETDTLKIPEEGNESDIILDDAVFTQNDILSGDTDFSFLNGPVAKSCHQSSKDSISPVECTKSTNHIDEESSSFPNDNIPKYVEPAIVKLQYVTRDDIRLDDDSSKLTATSYEGKSKTVVTAMKKREDDLKEKQIQAVMEKKERDISGVVKEEQRHAAKLKFGQILDTWAMDGGGEKKNIRTLLTTMHTVLWEGAEFTPITMSQVLLPEKVKLFYRKAMLKVHPDKNQDGSAEQNYIAQRIFEALNQAWSKFQDEQMTSSTTFLL